MLRVNQAGEYGAVRIYQGQMTILKGKETTKTLQHMLDQEKQHLAGFNAFLIEHNVAPTLFTPLWHVGGYAMGAISAMISEKAAHACTIAVEEVIDAHYQSQIDQLEAMDGPISNPINDPMVSEFKDFFQKCQAEEIEHKKIAENNGGRDAPLYPVLTAAVKAVSTFAIWLSKKI
ncbi:MAG: demethoxyubiquinone hydroxylase family protein [Alphaproteobacteria bacterium]|nr:demethoxyubiquinone hydroxylase family protein [Alphaproteobacteria bacterium]MBX9977314.1 demethoxyubiquinone hydroxylase family protein [Alphaproteobacteria bacterium]